MGNDMKMNGKENGNNGRKNEMMGNEMKWREIMGRYEKCPEITKSVWGFLLIPRSENSRG